MPAESDKIIREKIAGMDILPAGIEFNNANKWQQLEHALQPAKRRSAKWYYAAAVFLGMAVILLVLNKDHKHPVTTIASTKIFWPAKTLTVVTPKKNIVKKNASPVIHLKRAVAASEFNEPIPATITVVQNMNTTDLPQPTTAIEAPPNLAQPKPVVIITQKEPVKPKRLKIIHLNELGAEQEMIYTRAPLKKMQMTDDVPDESITPQINKAWWQPKPRPVTAIIDHP